MNNFQEPTTTSASVQLDCGDQGIEELFDHQRLGATIDQDFSLIFRPQKCNAGLASSSSNQVDMVDFEQNQERTQEQYSKQSATAVDHDALRPPSLETTSSADSFHFPFHDLHAVTKDSDDEDSVATSYTPLDLHSRMSNSYSPRHMDPMTAPNRTMPQGRVVVQTEYGPALLLPRHGRSNMVSPDRVRSRSDMNLLPPSQRRVQQIAPARQRNRKCQRWSEEEDDLLKAAVAACPDSPPNWRKISKHVFDGERSNVQCKSRWQKALQPGILRGDWRKEEDLTIVRLRAQDVKWSSIAEHLPGRLGEHIRDRYVNFLDPTLKKTPWTKEEDELLIQQQRLVGNRWTDISKVIHGRSENAIKNRWHNAKQTRLRRLHREAMERARQEQVGKLVPLPSSSSDE